jgi:hypothetical protein
MSFVAIHRPGRALATLGLLLLAATPLLGLRQEEDPAPPSLPLAPGEDQLRTFVELVRKDVQTEKATIIAENMHLSEDEAFVFWPLHREYSLELEKLFDARLAILRRHIGQLEQLTDEQARELAKAVFDLEERRLALKRAWFERFAEAITPRRAAQFFQLENQLNAAIDLRLAASLPLIRPEPAPAAGQ